MKTLPSWLVRRDDGVMQVDPDIAYPAILKALGVKEADIDQYWIEVAYQCAKLAVSDIVAGTEYDPRPKHALQIHILAAGQRKERWALRNHKAGRGAAMATKGREALAYYARIHNKLT